VREWWGDLHLSLIGVAGIWNDMNEPALNDPFGMRVKDLVSRCAPGAGENDRKTMRKFTICMG